ncbi:MAG: 4-hydroxy-3-methylbut-2-enyl diphosphate reductase [Nitrospinae bacterium]|nr:4-hydroxy-3-methylbut-2-enyl diphosphate reductase [Nitrospinota bacterium]
MKVRLAKSAGFCWGVRRTMNIALDAANSTDGPVHTFGPLIHNPQVVDLLASKGMKVVKDFEDLQEGATLVIRAHGIPPETRQELKDRGVKFRDGTCPLVAKVHAYIKKYLGQGYALVILGHRDHPEVIGHLGYAQGRGTVIGSAEDVDDLPPLEKVCLVSQTTANEQKFYEVERRMKAKYADCVVVNTICDDTHTRQEEVLDVAPTVDAMVVVGGKGSSNTQRLVELSESVGTPAFHVETAEELDLDQLTEYETVGVTAGASTPNWIIQQVVERLEHAQTRRRMTWQQAQRLLGLLTRTNLYVALGAGALTFANMQLLGLTFAPLYLLIASMYVFAMHTLNRLAEQEAGKLNDPLRTEFYQRYRGILLGSALACAVGTVALSFSLGLVPMVLVALMVVVGALYQIDLVSGMRATTLKYRRLKDIPTSKPLFVPLAWAAITLVLPAVSSATPLPWWGIGALSCITFLIVFMRSALLDIRDIQGDRMVGKETIPIVIGTQRTLQLLVGMTGMVGVWFIAAPISGWLLPMHASYIIGVAYIAVCEYLITRQRIVRGFLSESLVDGTFLLFGGLALLLLLVGR